MKILIVGAGALGCWLGATLFNSGLDINLYHPRQEKVSHIQKHGVKITHPSGEELVVHMPIFADTAEINGIDLAIVLVKAYDTRSAAEDISRLPGNAPDILSLQNGIGNMQVLAEFFPEQKLFPGVIYQGAQEVTPGHVLYAGPGRTMIAAMDVTREKDAADYAKVMSAHAIPVEAVEPAVLERERWQKLLVNAALNPVSALTKMTNGEVTLHAETLAQMAELTAEGVAVANSLGIAFDQEEAWQKVLAACQFTAPNKSSMLVDVERGKKTEIDVINGAIVRYGQLHGIATPANQVIMARIKALEPR